MKADIFLIEESDVISMREALYLAYSCGALTFNDLVTTIRGAKNAE